VTQLTYNVELSLLSYPFLNNFDGENLSRAPSNLGMLENQLVGRNSLEIKISDYENPLGAVRQILLENHLVGGQGLQIKTKVHFQVSATL
jgi:hypothetical protein